MFSLRKAIGSVCYRVDFSVAEALCVALVIVTVVYLAWSVVAVVRAKGRRRSRAYSAVLGAVCVGVSIYMGLSVNPAMDHTGEILKAIVAGGADAILTTYGIANRYQDVLRNVGLILRMDGGSSSLNSDDECPDVLYTVEDAVKMGADAMAPIIQKLYPKKEDQIQGLQRHLVFFNTNPNFGTLIHVEWLKFHSR